MKKNRLLNFIPWKAVQLSLLVIAIMLLTSSSVRAADPVNYCMDSGNTCAANDFGTLVAYVTTVYPGGCVDHDANPATPPAVKLDFYVTVNAAVPTRYDIGSILSIDGQPVLRDDYETDGCARSYLGDDHDYYELTTTDNQTHWPYLNPADSEWYYWDAEENGDTCGDLGGRDTANIYFNETYVGCVDSNNDGQIDLDICLLYDQKAGEDCYDLLSATPPGSVAKCECSRMTIPVSPTAITLESLNASSTQLNGTTIATISALVVAALVSLWLTVRLKKRYSQK